MQRAKQGPNKDKPENQAPRADQGGQATKGLPVAHDATQINEPRRTAESRGDRDDHIGSSNQTRMRQGGRGAH